MGRRPPRVSPQALRAEGPRAQPVAPSQADESIVDLDGQGREITSPAGSPSQEPGEPHGAGPSGPSDAPASSKRQFAMQGEQLVVQKDDRTFIVPSRSERGAAFAQKIADKNPTAVRAAQFCFFPVEAPRFHNPGALPFCHLYNRPGGSTFTLTHFEDPDCPGVPMCTSKELVRVHGCLWCGATSHAASECTGPRLPQSEVQMTLKEFNNSRPRAEANPAMARRADAATLRTKQADGRLKNKFPWRSNSSLTPRPSSVGLSAHLTHQ